MKGTSVAMKAELGRSVAHLARCWKIVPAIGDTLTVTDHDAEIVDPTDGLTYSPIPGGTQSDVSGDLTLSADNVQVGGAATDPFPTLDSVRAGDWDYAYVEFFYLCWSDPSKGRHFLRVGHIGEVSTALSTFASEFRGLLQALTTSIGEVTQPGCRHRFGDDLCNLDGTTDPSYYSVAITVDSVSADGTEISSTDLSAGSPDIAAANGYAWGRIVMNAGTGGGLNAGRSADIKSSESGKIILHLPFPYAVAAGDTAIVYEGCDGKRETCRDRFANILNFDGEPFAPGLDKTIAVAR